MALTQPDTPVAVAHIVVRYLRTSAPVTTDSLLKRLAPLGDRQEKLGSQQKTTARLTVSALRDAGVLAESEGRVGLSELARAAETEHGAISDCLFANTNPSDLWKEERKSALSMAGGLDLVRALSWFLTLDAFDGPYCYEKGKNAIAKRQQEELDAKVVVNSTRWTPFGRWASYLGFARLVDGRLAVDPTRAVERALERAGRQHESWTYDELLSLIADRLPVLDSGPFNEAIRKRQAANGIQEDTKGDVSPALTLAIQVLAQLGRLELEEGAGDAKKARFAHGLGAVHRIHWQGSDGD
jgi:hypothetical protein